MASEPLPVGSSCIPLRSSSLRSTWRRFAAAQRFGTPGIPWYPPHWSHMVYHQWYETTQTRDEAPRTGWFCRWWTGWWFQNAEKWGDDLYIRKHPQTFVVFTGIETIDQTTISHVVTKKSASPPDIEVHVGQKKLGLEHPGSQLTFWRDSLPQN